MTETMIVQVKKKRKWGWILLCYGIWASITSNGHNTTVDQTNIFTTLLLLVGLVATPILYYWLRDKIKLFNFIKNEGVRNFVIGFAFMIVAVLLISFLGALGDNWKVIAVRTPLGSQIESSDAITGTQLEAKLQADSANLQNQQNAYIKDIDEQTATAAVYQKNIEDYQAAEKLNDEEYAEAESGFTQLSSIFGKYSQSIGPAITDFLMADKNLTDAEDAVYEAKINYYQALLNNDTDAEIEAKRQAANDAVGNLNKVQPVAMQAAQNLQKASSEFAN